ncbi:MAG: UvrD-helicase domain-containing protein [Anaerolineae bacterium]|nr:UvrD-helicase domain-containing protein [Anaerolineae bacterium]
MPLPILDGLNDAQRQAVTAPDGPVLILAGPGSGKTRVLTHRIAWLITERGVPPYKIMAVTFTNKAAREMRARVEKLLGDHLRKDAQPRMGTFHAICAGILRREAATPGLLPLTQDYVIYDTDDQRALMKNIVIVDLHLDEKLHRPDALLSRISSAKNDLITPDLFKAGSYKEEITKRAYELYQQQLTANNAVDFDDLLLRVVQLFEQHPEVLARYRQTYDHILVDEFQDTNTAQYRLVRLLAAPRDNLFCVGDEDQCLPTGTPIQTPGGVKPIEAIKVGEQVIAAGGRGASMPSEVRHVSSRFHQGDVVRIVTRRGYSFCATPNHIIFAHNDQTLRVFNRGGKATGVDDIVPFESTASLMKPLGSLLADDALEVIDGAYLVESIDTLPAQMFELIPAGDLHPSMIVAVEHEGSIIQDEIAEVTWEPYQGDVYDLEVADVHNYLAGGVVVHNSIYRWRGADFRNVLRLREDYLNLTTVLLEQNYRSTQTILDAAVAVINRNTHRTPKKLFTDQEGGPEITVNEAYSETYEAQFIVDTIAGLVATKEVEPGQCAVMYRMNAQSRAIEDAFVRSGLPYRLVGATRFYSRKEIKDVLAYLRLIHNPDDSVSLLRVIGTPPRGIGQKTVDALMTWATEQGISAGQALIDLVEGGAAAPFAGRARSSLAGFGEQLHRWRELRDSISLVDLLRRLLGDIGYATYINDGTEEGEQRWANVEELVNVAAEYEELPLSAFLEEVALVSEVDNLPEEVGAPTLLTLHAAKGLEFDVVFMAGVEDGILPHNRSWDDPEEMAEERRLMYVGMTRACRRLYLIHAFQRTRWGQTEINAPSRFLDDIPANLMTGRSANQKSKPSFQQATRWEETAKPPKGVGTAAGQFKAGQRVFHAKFGKGLVIESKQSGNDEEVSIAFEGAGVKRLLASFARLEKIE